MQLFNKAKKKIFNIYKRPLFLFSKKNPVYIYHHIPKCGGTSINKILDNWFFTIRDYRSGYSSIHFQKKVNLNHLRSRQCLCGHFEFDGYYLHQRYPEAISSNRYKVFTFVRDPLQVQLSLFRYEKIHNHAKAKNIEEHLSIRPNYLASIFPATFENYKEVIDRYFFVGILEKSEASIKILASIMGKRVRPLPWLNKSHDNTWKTTYTEEISQALISRFRKENSLDYLIYDYCVEKFNRIEQIP